ncbi:hypothetical protein Pla52o_36140 [Novipirellula galeiformis]|uniref:Uncharacterized protein n=1 Tax=Novipirellula galeiformis TaxID=2528004 RepID=A0A5C6CF45_9BACT|nr:hypothetical protein Pla52o_36140 [Novipirellula galeiformis]
MGLACGFPPQENEEKNDTQSPNGAVLTNQGFRAAPLGLSASFRKKPQGCTLG